MIWIRNPTNIIANKAAATHSEKRVQRLVQFLADALSFAGAAAVMLRRP